MHKFALAALLMCGFSIAQYDLDPEQSMKQLDVKARQFTGMICDASYGASTITLFEIDLKYAEKHLNENYQRLWKGLDPNTRKVVKQVKSVNQFSETFYMKDNDESYFGHSWYDSKARLFYQNFCALKTLK